MEIDRRRFLTLGAGAAAAAALAACSSDGSEPSSRPTRTTRRRHRAGHARRRTVRPRGDPHDGEPVVRPPARLAARRRRSPGRALVSRPRREVPRHLGQRRRLAGLRVRGPGPPVGGGREAAQRREGRRLPLHPGARGRDHTGRPVADQLLRPRRAPDPRHPRSRVHDVRSLLRVVERRDLAEPALPDRRRHRRRHHRHDPAGRRRGPRLQDRDHHLGPRAGRPVSRPATTRTARR